MFDIWVNMMHNRHNILESRSSSSRGYRDNISPQEFIEIRGRVLNFQNLSRGEGGDRSQASCSQI